MTAQEPAAKLTGDEYMQLLTQRMNAFMEEQQRKADAAATGNQPARLPLLPPLLEWFIRPGDEDLVELPEPPAKPKPQPRYYRPASYWRERITRLETQMATVSARASVGDRAAAGGCASALNGQHSFRNALTPHSPGTSPLKRNSPTPNGCCAAPRHANQQRRCHDRWPAGQPGNDWRRSSPQAFTTRRAPITLCR